MGADVETAVVGAGVIGLAIGRALALAGQGVLVLERHDRIGTETSSRNSEVIHAGIYYAPGSLRASLCGAGKEMLYRFCAENGVAHQRCGKLLVATEEAELPQLESIAAIAAKNGVGDLQRLSAADVRALEPEVSCVAAYLSPSTGIIDSHGLMQAIEGHMTSLGGAVVLNATVTGISADGEGFAIETLSGGERSTLTARNLVLAGGLSATTLGRMLAYRTGYVVPETYPACGHYFALAGRAPFRHLVYPMPTGAWLGVHLTLDVAGRARFGPDIEWRDSVGVRPKIYREGEPVADFAIHGSAQHGVPRLVALYGMESPGLTSSLAIGDYVAALLADGDAKH